MGRRRARDAAAAVEAHFDLLRRATFTVADPRFVSDPTPGRARLATADPALLRGPGGLRLSLAVEQACAIAPNAETGTLQVVTAGYRYTLLVPTGAELLAFHWHPTSTSPAIEPHLHLGDALLADAIPGLPTTLVKELGKKHLPTGHVALRDVLRFAVVELGVTTRRPDSVGILERADEAFA